MQYCIGSNATTNICNNINSAVASGGSNLTAVGTAFINSIH
jgi:hypothetical protein